MKKKIAFDKFHIDSYATSQPEIIDKDEQNNQIAIIGMSCKFSEAKDVDEFWDILKNGIDCIRKMPRERKIDTDKYMQFIGDESDYYDCGYMDNIDMFDYTFFNISPKEASLIDPNQRLFIETAWEAIEDAGYCNKIIGSKTGVYVGFTVDQLNNYRRFIEQVEPSSMSISYPGNVTSIIASRLSYIFDLRGPSLTIDTSCSSTLVALHLACQALKSKECEMTIVGGAKVRLLPLIGNVKLGIESSDGRTKTFDDSSDGTGGGEGVAAVILKPLKKAIQDGDNIHAVIIGSAVNQDGKSIGITAPKASAQEDVIVSAWENAGVDPSTISYVEAHGTGTKLGDTVEIDGISKAFSRYTSDKQFCAIGSVKSNIGHLDNASGIAGLIKSILSLKHKQLPPSLHFRKPNHKINFIESPIYINDRLKEWNTDGYPRRCGISSFGLSGTNSHMILEEAPEKKVKRNTKKIKCQIFTMSTKTQGAMKLLINNYTKFLNKKSDLIVEDICYTANVGRGHYNIRAAFIVSSIEELRDKLDKMNTTLPELWFSHGILYKDLTKRSDSHGKDASYKRIEDIKQISNEANEMMAQYGHECLNELKILEEIIRVYVEGVEVDWEMLYQGDIEKQKTSIPVYPFDGRRCWINIPKVADKVTLINEELFYGTHWKNKNIESNKIENNNKTSLVIKDKASDENLIRILKEKGTKVIEVEIVKEFEAICEDKFSVGITEEDYKKLFIALKEVKFDSIIHMTTLTKTENIISINELEERLSKGVYSLFQMVKAIEHSSNKINIILISKYANTVNGDESRICPENSSIFGLAKVINKEYKNIHCKCIDIDDNTDMQMILPEVYFNEDTLNVAYRNGIRYIEEFKKLDMTNYEKRDSEIKQEGIYVITGGPSGIGLEVGKYLASKNKVTVAFINRTPIPPRDEWEKLLLDGNNKKLCKKIIGINEIEEKGSDVFCFCADVSNEKGMSEVIQKIKNNIGRINGIFHGAGVAGDGLIINREEKEFRKVFSPKVYGTWILHEITKNEKIDFLVLFSSLSSITGGAPGEGDYTAANAYMDSFGAYRNKLGMMTLTINWTAWKETGMAVDYGVNKDKIFKSLTTSQAIYGLDKAMFKDIDRVTIGQLNSEYNDIIDLKNIPISISEDLYAVLKSQKVSYDNTRVEIIDNVKLEGRDDKKYSEVEKKIAYIWKEVLGFEEINIYDSFFELGGDSILLMKIHSLMQKYFPDKVTITDLFSYSSISELAKFITNEKNCEELETIDSNNDVKLEGAIINLIGAVESGEISLEKAIEDYITMEDEK